MQLLLVLCLFFQGFAGVNRTTNKLREYESFSHFDLEAYSKQYSRSFNKEGVITQKDALHPLTISMYGIMSYDHYRRTGDSISYNRVLDQYKYFRDTTHMHYFDNGLSAGLPYTFNYKKLKAPWYSGMTQGTAVSFLLRYYELTQDRTALDLSRKLIRFMLKPEEEGGTIACSKEGGMWIEEYPGLAESKSVLNGFINGFIGLYEYCLYFPEDMHAAIVRDSCYRELIRTVGKYDRNNWTTYNRNGVKISNSYLRYQLEEFDHLYSLYGDIRLRDQMRIWSMFAFNKPDNELKFLKRPEYQFAVPVSGDPFAEHCSYSNYSGFLNGLTVAVPVSSKRGRAEYWFDTDRYYGEIHVLSSGLNAGKVTVTATYRGVTVPVTMTYHDKCVVVRSEKPFDALLVRYLWFRLSSTCPLTLLTYDHRESPVALFGFFTPSKTYSLVKGKTYFFSSKASGMINARVFYRYSQKTKSVEQSVYNFNQCFDLNGGCFTAPVTGTYQFFISYDIAQPESSLQNLKLETDS